MNEHCPICFQEHEPSYDCAPVIEELKPKPKPQLSPGEKSDTLSQ